MVALIFVLTFPYGIKISQRLTKCKCVEVSTFAFRAPTNVNPTWLARLGQVHVSVTSVLESGIDITGLEQSGPPLLVNCDKFHP